MQKLTVNQKGLIFSEYATTGITQERLADQYGVSRRTIGRAIKEIAFEQDVWAQPKQEDTNAPGKFTRYRAYMQDAA